jgi:hypothetical protein
MIDSTGPKISSRPIVMSLRTLLNSVGRTNQPSSPSGLPFSALIGHHFS